MTSTSSSQQYKTQYKSPFRILSFSSTLILKNSLNFIAYWIYTLYLANSSVNMGNYVSSCTLPSPSMRSSRAARVIFPGGEVRQFRDPTKAAELMLECPNFFVTSSKYLNIGKRFAPLGADEELEKGTVYVMIPMKRVSSMVSAADMASLFMHANSAARRISGGGGGGNNKGRISPDHSAETARSGENNNEDGSSGGEMVGLEGIEVEGFCVPEYSYKMSLCRSRKPTLATITEEPVSSR